MEEMVDSELEEIIGWDYIEKGIRAQGWRKW